MKVRWGRKFLPIFTVAMASFACVERGKPTQAHAPAQTRPVEMTAAVAPGWREHLFAEAKGERKVITALISELLRPEVVHRAGGRSNPENQHRLYRLNSEILAVARAGTLTDADESWLRAYREWLLAGCTAELNGCSSLSFFALQSNSAEVAMVLARREPVNTGLTFRLLAVALELKGRVYDPDLIQAVVKAGVLYVDQLRASQVQEARRIAHFLSTIIRQFADRAEVERNRDLALALGIAEPIRRAELVRAGFHENSLMALLGRAGGVEGKTEDYFAQVTSLRQVAARLSAGRVDLVRQMGLEAIQEWDSGLMILDQVFLGQLDVDQAMVLLRGVRLDATRLGRQIRYLFQVRFLETLAEATATAKDHFFDREVSDREFFFHALRSAALVQPLWGRLTARSANFRKIALLALRQAGAPARSLEDSTALFDGLQRNIKFMGVYPQMMALTYHMARRNAKAEVLFYGRSFAFDSSTIIENVFLGIYDPWFDYSEDRKPLNFLEILSAFDFALRSGVFEQFQIPIDGFVVEIVERLTRKSSAKILDYQQMMNQRFAGANFLRFRSLCKDLSPATIETVHSLGSMRLSPLLGPLNEDIFEPIGAKSSYRQQKQNQGLYIFDAGLARIAEEARLDLGNVQRWLSGLLASYREYLIRSGSPDWEAKLASATAAKENLKTLRVGFLRQVVELYRELDQCYTKAIRADEAVKLRLMEMEESYLRQVHADITRVRSGQASPEQIKAKWAFTGLPSGFVGLDEWSKDGYLYHQLDFLLRNHRYLKTGLRTDSQSFAPVAPRVELNVGGKLDADAEFVRKTERIFLPYLDDVDEFVKAGLTAVFTKPTFVAWYSLGAARLSFWNDRLHVAAILYRLGDADIIKAICSRPGLCASESEIVAPDELINIHREMLDLASISPGERRFMEMAQVYRKRDYLSFSRRVLDYSVYSGSVTDLWGLFDLPAVMVTTEVLGTLYEMQEISRQSDGRDMAIASMANREGHRHYGYRKLGQTYYQTRHRDERRSFLFEVNGGLDRAMDHEVRSFVQSEVRKTDLFVARLRTMSDEFARLPVEQRPRVDLNLREAIRSPMVRSAILTSFEQEVRVFDRGTGGCLLRSECSDF